MSTELKAIAPTEQLHELARANSKASIEKIEHVEPYVVSAFHGLTRQQTVRTYWKAVLFCLFASVAAAMDGFQTKIPGSIIANRGFINQFGTITDANGLAALDPLNVAAWGGIFQGGVIFGNLYGGFLSDLIGRKWILAWLTVLLSIGVAIECVATNWQVWGVAKIFTGMGNGLVQTQCVIYVAEVAPITLRGALLASYALFYQLGGLCGAIGLQVLATSNESLDFRRVIYSQWLFTGLFILAWPFMPETAWYHARKDNHEQAKIQLRKLYGKDFVVEQEYALMTLQLQEERKLAAAAGETNFTEIFRGSNLRRFLISASIPLFAQLSGNSLVNGYTSYFFQLAGMANPFLGSMIVSLIGLLGVLGAFFTSDIFGRRPLAIGAGCSMSLSLFIIAIMSVIPDTTARSTVLISFMCTWAFSYNSGIAPIGPAYQGETATPRLRAKTNSLSQATAQSLSLVFSYSVPIMLSKWNIRAAFFFFATCSIATVVLFFLLPEYKNRSYAELDEMFVAKVPARRFKAYKTTAQHAAEENQERTRRQQQE